MLSPPKGKARRPDGAWPERYDLIDAWRGLAALAVVIHHVALIPIGGPAVMLFFVISGYCIAASADSCQRKGLSFGRFMMRRVRRIYPPYLFSVAFWALTRAIKMVASGGNDLVRPWTDWVQNITLTQWLTIFIDPSPSAHVNKTLFVAAFWSLCYEEQFYLLMGLLLASAMAFGLSIRATLAVTLFAGLAWNIAFPEIACGLFIEYWALFCMGGLIFYRLCRSPNRAHRIAVDLLLVGVLIFSLWMRLFSGQDWVIDYPALTSPQRMEYRLAYQELAIASGFGLLLILMRPLNEAIRSHRLFRPLAALGAITFSLYLIHQFNLSTVLMVVDRVLGLVPALEPGTDAHTTCSLIMQVAGHVVLASVFWYFFERPFLNRPLSAPASPNPVPPAASPR